MALRQGETGAPIEEICRKMRQAAGDESVKAEFARLDLIRQRLLALTSSSTA